jgi:hypothetical protein
MPLDRSDGAAHRPTASRHRSRTSRRAGKQPTPWSRGIRMSHPGPLSGTHHRTMPRRCMVSDVCADDGPTSGPERTIWRAARYRACICTPGIEKRVSLMGRAGVLTPSMGESMALCSSASWPHRRDGRRLASVHAVHVRLWPTEAPRRTGRSRRVGAGGLRGGSDGSRWRSEVSNHFLIGVAGVSRAASMRVG